MLSLIAGVILFFLCAYVGFCLRKFYKDKKAYFKEIEAFLLYYENTVRYLKEPLSVLSEKYAPQFSKPFAQDICQFSQTRKELGGIYLNKAEKQTVSRFFNALGDNDLTGELNAVKSFRESFAPICESICKKCDNNASLSYKLSILLGVAVMIIAA